ncbi:hypothetical protein, partial [Streptococcus pneumoniae]
PSLRSREPTSTTLDHGMQIQARDKLIASMLIFSASSLIMLGYAMSYAMERTTFFSYYTSSSLKLPFSLLALLTFHGV